MQKVYQRINWENDPSTNTPINEDNLNKMDYTIDKLDDRVVALYGYQDSVAQIEKNAKIYANNAKTSETNAKTSETNTKQSELKAKEYMENAFKTTPDGYKAVVEKVDLMDIQTSTENTLYNTKNGGLRMKMKGNTEQKTYNGYQLFDASKLPTHSAGGATVTNNGDGSFTVSGSGELSEQCAVAYLYTREEAIKLVTAGYIECFVNTATYPWIYMQFLLNNDVVFGLTNNNTTGVTGGTIQQSWFDDESFCIRIGVYGGTGGTIIPGTIKPMIYQEGDGTWEPFVGAQPSPSPDFPQSIMNTGDCVEMIQGKWDVSTGAFGTSTRDISSKRAIPCKTGDIVKLSCEKTVSTIFVLCYNESGFVSYLSAWDTNEGTFTIPSNCTSFKFRFDIGSNSNTVGKISLTVNGKYVMQILEHGKNLAKHRGMSNAIFDEYSGTITATATNNTACYGAKLLTYNNSSLVSAITTNINTGKHAIGFVKTSAFNMIHVGFSQDKTDSIVVFDVSHLTDGKTYYVQMRISEMLVNGGKIKDIMITTNPEYDPTYEPYREHIATIFTEQPIRDLDVLEKNDDGLWQVERVNNEITLNADMFLTVDTIPGQVTTRFVSATLGNAKSQLNNSICSHYRIITYTDDCVGYYIGDNASIYLKDGRFTTLSEFREWLSENNVKFQYELATPTYEILDTQSQLALNSLKTFNGATHITIDSRVQPEETMWEFGTSHVGARVIRAENENDTLKIQLEDAINTMLLIGAQ